MPRRRSFLALAALSTALAAFPAGAEDMPVFRIEMKDGAISPARLTVPADKPFKLDIHNLGSTPAEFESLALHKEKVLPAESSATMVFRRLSPGEYDFFDDFHPGAKAVLVAE